MRYQYTPYALLPLGTVVIALALALYAWRRRKVPGATPFVGVAVAAAAWALANTLEMAGADLPTKLFWADLQYVSYVGLPVAWLALAVEYARSGASLTWRQLRWLLVVPGVTLALLTTNGQHWLIRQDVYLDEAGPLAVVGKTYGPWFWVHAAYSYLLLAIAAALLVGVLRSVPPAQRAQPLALVSGLLLPVAANVLYVFGLSPVRRVDPTPIVAGLAGIPVLWALVRGRLFDVVPVARDRVVEGLNDGMVTLDDEGRIVDLNPAAGRILGLAPTRVVGRSAAGAFAPWPGLVTLCRGDGPPHDELALNTGGALRHYEVHCSALAGFGGQSIGQVLLLHDITERKQWEEQLAYLATHDPLTELPNRRSLEGSLRQVLARVRRGAHGALLFLDVDNFKRVNDLLGHTAGDKALARLTRLLRETLRPEDIFARVGGDEFAVLMVDTDEAEALAIAERMRLAASKAHFVSDGHSLSLELSIGLVMIAHQPTPGLVLSQADAAMYRAKALGRNRTVVFRPEEDDLARLSEASRWAARLRGALRAGLFTLHYQPIVWLGDRRVEHYEALLRLRGAADSVIPAGSFIQAAERFGLMPELTRWVIQEVVSLLRRHPSVRVYVNLSAQSVADEELLHFVVALLAEHAVEPGRLGFEITETTLVRDFAQAERWIHPLKALGCRFALDDFGAGSSSFSYLRNLPVDVIKIDGSIVASLEADPVHRALVEAMQTLAVSLGRAVVAEHVESEAILQILRKTGVALGQGYYLGEPRPELPPS